MVPSVHDVSNPIRYRIFHNIETKILFLIEFKNGRRKLSRERKNNNKNFKTNINRVLLTCTNTLSLEGCYGLVVKSVHEYGPRSCLGFSEVPPGRTKGLPETHPIKLHLSKVYVSTLRENTLITISIYI